MHGEVGVEVQPQGVQDERVQGRDEGVGEEGDDGGVHGEWDECGHDEWNEYA